MAYQLDYSQAGQIIVTGDRRFTVHLSAVSTFAPSTITINGVLTDDSVALREIESGIEHKFDIRDCSSPVYATTEDLMDAIEAQVAAMYGGGGGGAVAWGAITGTLSSQTDLNTALGLKAPLASPTFTGTPAGPTAAPGTSTTQFATTAFVDAIAQLAPLPTSGTGAALMFDTNYVLNSPDVPSNATVTLDTSNALENAQVIACFNHSSQPAWPSGITAVGHWDNSGLNVVFFVYKGTSNILATIVSSATVAWTNPTTTTKQTSDVVNSTTTPATITGHTITGIANHTYAVHGWVRVNGTTLVGANIGFGGALTSVNANYFGASTNVTTFVTGPGNTVGTVATADFGEFTTAGNAIVNIYATLVVDGTGGAINLIGASETGGTAVTFRSENSILQWTDLG